ncbi:Hypothetical protein ORPV_815 [Orpheovirus IHUMI-LCC2]|uniref:Uncharacterized protein n=1 Tax=Orpheovirus IHUMI-LCC2 TaxID=2023057 RepID=A0A2I2L5I7_9VIRU|nr:Hypothetical protein ORPV_815 [Orpheovirus IHUMI-LCC2]SNW62719.1 Hypothetical protein ORPV_815 [Orpheovirus IHUMI-LCC2]
MGNASGYIALTLILFIFIASIVLVYIYVRYNGCIVYPSPQCWNNWTCSNPSGETINRSQQVYNLLNQCFLLPDGTVNPTCQPDETFCNAYDPSDPSKIPQICTETN